MAVHGGLLRTSTPGDGAIVDLTDGVRSVVRRSEVQIGVVTVFAVGSTVAVTTMEHEPGGVADLQALLDRLIPPDDAYEPGGSAPYASLPPTHEPRHERARAPAREPDRAVGEHSGGRRRAGAGHLAAGRARRLRRPPPGPGRVGAGAVLSRHGHRLHGPGRLARTERPERLLQRAGLACPRGLAILPSPPRAAPNGPRRPAGPRYTRRSVFRAGCRLGRAHRRNPLPGEARRSLKTQQHAHLGSRTFRSGVRPGSTVRHRLRCRRPELTRLDRGAWCTGATPQVSTNSL
jgi:hypothetical protein